MYYFRILICFVEFSWTNSITKYTLLIVDRWWKQVGLFFDHYLSNKIDNRCGMGPEHRQILLNNRYLRSIVNYKDVESWGKWNPVNRDLTILTYLAIHLSIRIFQSKCLRNRAFNYQLTWKCYIPIYVKDKCQGTKKIWIYQKQTK